MLKSLLAECMCVVGNVSAAVSSDLHFLAAVCSSPSVASDLLYIPVRVTCSALPALHALLIFWVLSLCGGQSISLCALVASSYMKTGVWVWWEQQREHGENACNGNFCSYYWVQNILGYQSILELELQHYCNMLQVIYLSTKTDYFGIERQSSS